MIPKSEIRTKKWLEKNGYYYIRAGRSFGLFDFVAMNLKGVYLIQAKCSQGPRSEELARLKAFNNHPSNAIKWVFIWKAWDREPTIKEIPNDYQN